MMLTYTEENYLKAIFHLSGGGDKEVSTNSISESMSTKPASVSDMLKKLSQKNLINYEKYKGLTITKEGIKTALQVIRKHRLWEVFLVEKLKFNWDEVHEVAEELEHIRSNYLVERMDEFLGFPQYDPHGDPIPDSNGQIKAKNKISLTELPVNNEGIVVGVKESTSAFLKYLDKSGIHLGAKIKVLDKIEFDGSIEIEIDNKKTLIVSQKVSDNIFVTD